MNTPTQPFTVTDLRVPYWRLVVFLIKLGLAAIPAAIILGIIYAIIGAAIVAVTGGHTGWMMQRWT
jgi:hypothetical protein